MFIFLFFLIILIIFINNFFLQKNLLISETGDVHQKFASKSKIPLTGGLMIFLGYLYFLDDSVLSFIFFSFIILILGILSDLKVIKSANFKLDGVPIHINLVQILLSSGFISLCIYLSWYVTLILRSYNKKNTSLIFFICLIFLFYQQIGHIYDRNLFLVFAIIFFSGLNNNYLMQPLVTNKKI